MTRNFYFVILLILVVFSGCTSGKKAFEKGDYYQSTLQAVERLRKNPDHKKSRAVLEKSYPLAIQYYTDRINNLRQTNNPFKNGEIVDNYQAMNRLYEEIQRCPGALKVIPSPRKFYDEALTYSRLAAEEHYKAGIDQLKSGTREDAKNAYYNFKKANEYSPGYKDVLKMIDQAYDLAILKVLVDQIPVPTVQFQLSVEFFQDKVEEFLSNYRENEFIRFYAANNSNKIKPDQVMVVRFDGFTVGNTNNYQNSKELKKDSVVVGKVKMDDGTQKDVIGSVKATYTEFGREIISEGMVSMRIVDAESNQVMLNEKFPGKYVWRVNWASFNGDERALTREQMDRTKVKPMNPPPPQDLFVEFCKPIYDQLTYKVRSYYSRF
jgi:tetratricopeptide (TPR) repeat protein